MSHRQQHPAPPHTNIDTLSRSNCALNAQMQLQTICLRRVCWREACFRARSAHRGLSVSEVASSSKSVDRAHLRTSMMPETRAKIWNGWGCSHRSLKFSFQSMLTATAMALATSENGSVRGKADPYHASSVDSPQKFLEYRSIVSCPRVLAINCNQARVPSQPANSVSWGAWNSCYNAETTGNSINC